MRSALTLVLGILLAAAAPGLRAQATTAAPQPGNQQHRQRRKSPQRKSATQKVAKAPKPAKPVETAVNPDAPKEGEQGTVSSRRDPFESLVARQQAQKHATAAAASRQSGTCK